MQARGAPAGGLKGWVLGDWENFTIPCNLTFKLVAAPFGRASAVLRGTVWSGCPALVEFNGEIFTVRSWEAFMVSVKSTFDIRWWRLRLGDCI